MNHPEHKVAYLWAQSTEAARTGIERGFLTQAELFGPVAQAAHCSRDTLPLLDAHAIALDAVRHELAALRARAGGVHE